MRPIPQWTLRFADRTVVGEDQLGVESAAQGYQQYLIPGVVLTTAHAERAAPAASTHFQRGARQPYRPIAA